MLKRTWCNSLALFLIVNLLGVLKSYLGLDLIDPRSSYYLYCTFIKYVLDVSFSSAFFLGIREPGPGALLITAASLREGLNVS